MQIFAYNTENYYYAVLFVVLLFLLLSNVLPVHIYRMKSTYVYVHMLPAYIVNQTERRCMDAGKGSLIKQM